MRFRSAKRLLLKNKTTVGVVVLLTCLVIFRSCQRPEEGLALTQIQQDAVMRMAWQALSASLAQAEDPPVAPELQAVLPRGPVWVSLYGPSRAQRQSPSVGFWDPQAEPAPSLANGVVRAARRALNHRTSLDGVTVKVDLAGAPVRQWISWASYLQTSLDTGRDGLLVRDETIRTWSLPSWPIERGWSVPRMVREVWQPSVQAGRLYRFRTHAMAGASPTKPAESLFRGNVLVPGVNKETVQESLIAAGKYLARQVGPDGRFCYNYLPVEDRCDDDYNLLRHAGTVYSMFQIYRVFPERSLLQAAERATQWLRLQARPVKDDPSRVFLLEGTLAKLGAVGLSMLAFVEREKALNDGRDKELLAKLADFVRSQQNEDGYLVSFYRWTPEHAVPPENSIYYPGEALLGLVRLHQIDPQPRYLEAAKKTADFLVRRRWRWAGIELYVPPDAWLTQAVAELDDVAPDDHLRDYAYAIVDLTEATMLRHEEGAPPDLDGGPASGWLFPGVTPAGARSEGSTAAWKMAKRRQDHERMTRLRLLTFRAARFQMSQQFRPSTVFYLPNPARVLGGFRETAASQNIRIDYVQHNVTGLLGVLDMLETPP